MLLTCGSAMAALPAELERLRLVCLEFRALPASALRLLWFFLEESPNPKRFDRGVMRNHEGFRVLSGMPTSSRMIAQWLREKVPQMPLRTGWWLPYTCPDSGDTSTAHIACIDFAAALRVLFMNRFIAKLIATEAQRDANLPRAWNWVPGPRRSALVEKHPALSHKFGVRHGTTVNRGRNGPWLLYYDGTQAFRQSKRTNMYNVYATRLDYPRWFREMDSAWLWVAAFPVPVVKALGLSTLLAQLAERLFPNERGAVTVLDTWHNEVVEVPSSNA